MLFKETKNGKIQSFIHLSSKNKAERIAKANNLILEEATLDDIKKNKWYTIRAKRDILLKQTDWTQLVDNQLTTEEKEQYRQYRQALRDLTETYKNPENLVWPQLDDYLYKLPEKQNIFKKLLTKTKSIDQD